MKSATLTRIIALILLVIVLGFAWLALNGGTKLPF